MSIRNHFRPTHFQTLPGPSYIHLETLFWFWNVHKDWNLIIFLQLFYVIITFNRVTVQIFLFLPFSDVYTSVYGTECWQLPMKFKHQLVRKCVLVKDTCLWSNTLSWSTFRFHSWHYSKFFQQALCVWRQLLNSHHSQWQSSSEDSSSVTSRGEKLNQRSGREKHTLAFRYTSVCQSERNEAAAVSSWDDMSAPVLFTYLTSCSLCLTGPFVGFMSWKPKLCKNKQIDTWNCLNCGPWIYNLWKFNFLNGIMEINKLFHDIKIFWKGSVHMCISKSTFLPHLIRSLN